jgi:ABC-2 type transport system ATP-binding protein
MGLTNVANSLIKKYSGGMVRRLEIACALLIKPRILFLDEPTLGLDPSARKAVWENLTSVKKEYGTTIFFNTHYMDEADLYSDEIAIINRGRIVKHGSASELKRSLRSEVIRFNLGKNVIDEEILNRIRLTDHVIDVSLHGLELDTAVENGELALLKIIDVLRSHGITIERISNSKPTLDDVFLKYADALHPMNRSPRQASNGD